MSTYEDSQKTPMNRYSPYLTLLEQYLGSLDEWRSGFDREDSEQKSGLTADIQVSNEKKSSSEKVTPSSKSTSLLPLNDPSGKRYGEILQELTDRLKGNYPFHHPRYAGQMLKPPHPIAWLAYSLAMTINPNNHALDGGPPTSEMELDVLSQIAKMLGYSQHLGHLTSGGTVANLEALWVARESHPGKGVAFSPQAHYTHSRMAQVIGIEGISLGRDTDKWPDELRQLSPSIGTIVVTIGTTGRGKIEPLHRILPVAKELGLRIHVDAAYGGFFKILAGQEGISNEPWQVLGDVDSIVIDPHKHGLQPYGCGAVLFKDPSVGKFYKHDSPYTYFTSDQLHLGEITLECSRAGATAAALWATLNLLPLTPDGLGQILRQCRLAALDFAKEIEAHPNWTLLESPELDIVLWYHSQSDSTSELSKFHKTWFESKMNDPESPWFVSLYEMDANEFYEMHPHVITDSKTVTLLRSVFMKPEHHGGLNGLLD